MKKAFTLIELLVVIGVISLLLAITIPALRSAREQGREIVCRSKLRQLGAIMRLYTSEHDNMFPPASRIYYSGPFDDIYYVCCRWHDERTGYDSVLLRENPGLRGVLWPYLGDREIVRCSVGRRANELRGCYNTCLKCRHDGTIPTVCQYTYTMNAYLGSEIRTGLDEETNRTFVVRRTSQVTRNPSEVFVFGEQNSWAINTGGIQPVGAPHWPADYDLSGKAVDPQRHDGTLRGTSLQIIATWRLQDAKIRRDENHIGHAFATYHRPERGDLNTGHSFTVMLDGHVEKVTVVDQLRQSRRPAGFAESRFGPGGNLALAWPLDVPPPRGWASQ